MPRKKTQQKPAPQRSATNNAQPPTVSGSWLIKSLAISFAGAILCTWGALCLLFWQGSWQLLYHPVAAVARTPASVGLAYEQIGFAATESGELRLQGWWIPAGQSASAPSASALAATSPRYTALYLHGQNGNLGDTVDSLARLHKAGVNILAFDYRGFGQSHFARPSEARWREDAAWALHYLTDTRHIAPAAIVLSGSGLGANLALAIAAEHPELAGVIVDAPREDPMQAVFSDARASLVPAHALMHDRFDLDAAAVALRIPSLWFVSSADQPKAYQKTSAFKTLVPGTLSEDAISDWLAGLQTQRPID